MADNAMQSLFATPKEMTKEQIEKEKKEAQEKNNPFLHKKTIDPVNGIGAMRISIDNMGDSIEKYYFHFQKIFTRHKDTSFGMPVVELYKLKDVFDASVSSSFHGQIGSKISAMQQQVSTYLTQIGQLSKSLFPMVREIRLMDERLELYRKSFTDKKDQDSLAEARQNEVALKSTWIEVVEQGMQNPNSVYSMATKLGFVTLPDLFFGINPPGKNGEEQLKSLTKALDSFAKQQEVNFKVRTALEKKLIQYYTWKDKTYAEMHHTYKFRIKNLKQHYNVILLYMTWLKPYMTSLKALQMKGDITAPELINAFETSKLELELLAVMKSGKKYKACVLTRFKVVTRPELSYGQGGARQVTHSGQVDISIEAYSATQEDIDFYKTKTDKDIFRYYSGMEVDVAGDIESMLKSLGTDVEEYLREAETGERKEKKEESKAPQESVFAPFTALKDSFKIFMPEKSKNAKPNKTESMAEDKEKIEMGEEAAKKAWMAYDIFKKSNGMMAL
ncbi:hypothetical protein EXS74_00880 [Candidatus Woesearchaeota archaeon]|nr:hypothetical protein [Candidatus Woesearchaeota archaeon]